MTMLNCFIKSLSLPLLVVNNSEIMSAILTAIIPGLITGGLAFLGVVVSKRSESKVAKDQHEIDVSKATNSSAIDMIEIYHTEVKELREDITKLNEKNEKLLNELTDQKIKISNLIQKNEDLAIKNEELIKRNEDLQKKNEELSKTNHEVMKQNEILLAKLENFDK